MADGEEITCCCCCGLHKSTLLELKSHITLYSSASESDCLVKLWKMFSIFKNISVSISN